MQKMYFIAPNVDSAKRLVEDLLLARIDERHIQVIAKDGIPLEDLPEASIFQKTDLEHALEQGLTLGGASGMLAGLAALALPGPGLVLGGGAVLLATTLAGATVGTFGGLLRAVNIPNTHLQEFEREIIQGRILIIVGAPKEKRESVRRLVAQKHPEVSDRTAEAPVHVFP